jgi:serine/threonine-protein kinase
MIGKNIPHYKIIEELGCGSMGIIYKAKDTRLERTVAIKFLPYQIAINLDQRNRFKREAKAAATLNHTNIATIYGLEEVKDELFIVMEYIDGQNLRNILDEVSTKQNTPFLPIKTVLNYITQIAQGLLAAHEKGIIHRDIKPENVMINSRGQIKITDFGLAKIVGSELLTKIGVIVGTVAYMSPEQTSGEPVDHRTDIWSLGVMLYEMIAGHRPFRGQYEQATIYSILNEDPEPLKNYYPDISDNLENISNRILAKNSTDRYQHCEQLLNDLQSCAEITGHDHATHLKEPVVEKEIHENAFKRLQRSSFGFMRSINKQLKIPWKIAMLIILLMAISIFVILQKSPTDDTPGKKIAVLPFININNNPADEYFSDGIMEDILTQLVKISDLKVISRTTMMRYKNSSKAMHEISKELKADVVLEGSVRHDANHLRISVQLIDAKTDEHLWAETYDKELNQVFVIQSEIALKIASTLQAKLSQTEKDLLQRPKIYNPEAYNLILKGRYLVNKLDSANVVKAIDLFEEALSIEPNNANIWTSLANAHTVLAELGYTNLEEAYSKARKMVEKALLLDNQLANAHTVLGMIKLAYDWDWMGAETEFQKAIKIEPRNTTTINQMGQLARTLGRIDEAIILIQQTIELEPVILINYVYLAHFLMYADRLDEAISTLEKGLELNPQFPYFHYLLGCTYLLKGEPNKAMSEMEKELTESYRTYGLPLVYYDLGRKTEADIALKNCISKYNDVGAYYIAQIYAYFGDNDHAFEWLEKAYLLRDGSLPYIKGDPLLKNTEKDYRYNTFMKKMNLPI